MTNLKFESAGREEEQLKPAQLEEKGVIEKVAEIIMRALTERATEIHLEPSPKPEPESRVRMRVDGVLKPVPGFSSGLHSKIANRIKILGSMDITKSRIAQSGFFRTEHDGQKVEIGAYIFPTVIGEKVTLSLQFKRGLELSLEHLGFFTEVLKLYKDALAKPHGLVLVAGPPASGRTTTSYASLALLNSPQKAVAAFEQVNKYELPGIVQGKPSFQGDFTFRDGVRAMMESGPDVALVGEVNDPEVARLMIQGAFAKRIVIGRMAAHDAANAVTTLVDMGVQPFLLTAAVNGVLAQRLVRRICDRCKEPYVPPEQVVGEIGYKMRPDIQFFRGKGCAACGGTGYRGHIGLFELLILNEEINEAIVQRKSPNEVREAAANGGMISLKRDGVNKVVMGYTSIEEVLNSL
jgi:type II secretory ATPase GspE/PulE/Tfp pilus assembly ATPase PilB-like protein